MGYQPIDSPATFDRCVLFGKTEENVFLAFKPGYDWRGAARSQEAIEVCLDLVQFANSRGGRLLVGIQSAEGESGAVASSMVPVSDPERFVAWVTRAVRLYVHPASFEWSFHVIELPGGPIVAINVPPSIRIAAVGTPTRQGILFPYRAGWSRAFMMPDEVERRVRDVYRSISLRMEDAAECADLSKNLVLVPPVQRFEPAGMEPAPEGPRALASTLSLSTGCPHAPAAEDEPAACELRLLSRPNDRVIKVVTDPGATQFHLPLPLVADVWVTSDARLGLRLVVLIRYERGQVRFCPLEGQSRYAPMGARNGARR